MSERVKEALQRARAANDRAADAGAVVAEARAAAEKAREENAAVIAELRAEREALNTGMARGDARTKDQVKALSRLIRELEGAPKAFSRAPGERTAMRVRPGAKTGG